jgi:hypothetical protein
VIASDGGVEVKDLPWRKERALTLADSATLAHGVGTNGFFTALLRDQQTHSDRRLSVWWSAWRCAEDWGRIVSVPQFDRHERGVLTGATHGQVAYSPIAPWRA